MSKKSGKKIIEDEKSFQSKPIQPKEFSYCPGFDYSFMFNQMRPSDFLQRVTIPPPGIFSPSPNLQGFQPPGPLELYQNDQIRLPLPPTRFEDEPRYVNAKQYVRIMKMREKRMRQPEKPRTIRKYKHESRHRHAIRRQRCENGRFISKKKFQNKDQSEENEESDEGSLKSDSKE